MAEVGENCFSRGSVYFVFKNDKTPKNSQAMIDLLSKCEETELKRLEDENMDKAEPPKYRALRDGVGYKKGEIFERQYFQ